MNAIGEADNIFASLFDKVPAKRAGNESDMAGTVLYVASRAGVSPTYVPATLAILICIFTGLRRRYLALR